MNRYYLIPFPETQYFLGEDMDTYAGPDSALFVEEHLYDAITKLRSLMELIEGRLVYLRDLTEHLSLISEHAWTDEDYGDLDMIHSIRDFNGEPWFEVFFENVYNPGERPGPGDTIRIDQVKTCFDNLK